MAAVERALVATRTHSDAAVVTFTVVSLVWIGALLGVSFLATPVKFLAPTLTLSVALDVGRQTFHWFNRVEIVLAIAALVTAFVHERPKLARAAVEGGVASADDRGYVRRPYATLLAAFLAIAVALQGLWLLPVLDARVEAIIQGGTPPPSALHDVYVLLEAAKLGALVGAAWLGIASLRAGSRSAVTGDRDGGR